jgi:hypothetical protein
MADVLLDYIETDMAGSITPITEFVRITQVP